MSFSERLKTIIDEDYKTQSNFADAIRVTKASVNDYLSSKRKPNFDVLSKIAELGYNMNWLLTGKGSRKKELFNYEMLDQYDKSIIDSAVVHVGGFVKNKNIVPGVKTSTEQISKFTLIYLYYSNMIEALILELTYSNCYKFFKDTILFGSFLEDYVFEVLMPAINDYLMTGKSYNLNGKKENENGLKIVEKSEFVYSLAEIYVVYSEIIDLKERMEETDLLGMGGIKETYMQIFDLMKNETYLMVKSKKFENIIAKTFNIEI